MVNQSRKRWVRRSCFNMPSKRLPSLPRYRATQDNSFSEARDWNISVLTGLVLGQLNQARTIFPKITFPMWFQVRVVHNSYSWSIWKVEVKQQLSCCNSQCTATGAASPHNTLSPICWLSLLVWAHSSSSSCQQFSQQSVKSQSVVKDASFMFHSQVWKWRETNRGSIWLWGSTLASFSSISHPAFLLDFWLCWSIAISESSSDTEATDFHS